MLAPAEYPNYLLKGPGVERLPEVRRNQAAEDDSEPIHGVADVRLLKCAAPSEKRPAPLAAEPGAADKRGRYCTPMALNLA